MMHVSDLVFTLILIAFFWCSAQNAATLADRRKIIDFVIDSADTSIFLAFIATSYERHFFARLFLRNPRKLYPPELRGAF